MESREFNEKRWNDGTETKSVNISVLIEERACMRARMMKKEILKRKSIICTIH